MRYIGRLVVMTAMVVMAIGSARANIMSPGPPTLGGSAAALELSSLSAVKSDDSLSQRIFAELQNSTVGRLFASASPDGDKNGCDTDGNYLSFDGKPKPCPPPPPPPPRSKRCPPFGKDHDQDGDDRDNDHHHDRCGKGDDGNNP